MASYGLTDNGFIMPTYDQVLDNYLNALSDTFGTDVATGEDTVFGQFFRILAYTDYTLWEGLQGVYNTQTLNGAEGVYLDDLFSKRGLYRKSASAGAGYAFVKTTASADWSYEITTDTYFTGTNDILYYVSSDTDLKSKVSAYTLTKSSATSTATSITFYCSNYSTGSLSSTTLTTTDASFLTNLATFIQGNVSDSDASSIFVSSNTLYVGFDSSDLSNPVGLSNTVSFYANHSLGTKWSLIPITASTKGFYALGKGGISGISSTFTGYSATGNFTEFSSGSDVETDAEFRARFNDEQDEAQASTRPAIIRAILDLDGVTKVRIYDNPTNIDSTEAEAFTFNTIVAGGVQADIAQTLYETKPINTKTYGSISTIISTEDGGTETIKYTSASEAEYDIKLQYTTANEKSLTTREKSAIVSALTTLEANFEIGSGIYLDQIKGVVYGALSFGRLTSLTVYAKLSNEEDSSYSTDDISPAYYEIPNLDLDNISYSYGVV